MYNIDIYFMFIYYYYKLYTQTLFVPEPMGMWSDFILGCLAAIAVAESCCSFVCGASSRRTRSPTSGLGLGFLGFVV